MNDLELYEARELVVTQKRGNYAIALPGDQKEVVLVRDTDFGVIPGTKKPSLFKSGAEKVCQKYGMLQHYTIESKIEDAEKPFFMYTVKCELVKISNDGKEYVFYSAYGSANTAERRNGRSSAYDSANATLKMAQKRALTSAVISMGTLSDLFTQDMENEDFMQGYEKVAKSVDPNALISAQQIKRLYAIANEYGFNAAQAKKLLAENGVNDTKQIRQSEYDAVCAIFEKEDK